MRVLRALFALFALACTSDGPPKDSGDARCRCAGELLGAVVDLACGETTCIAGQGLRCTGPGTAITDPLACAVDGGSPRPDAAIRLLDAGSPLPDGGSRPDAEAPSQPLALFEPCGRDAECDSGLCALEYPRPFCTSSCESSLSCGTGVCLDSQCVPSCERGDRRCDGVGGACLPRDRGTNDGFCVPTCEDDGRSFLRCSPGRLCDPQRGECVEELSSGGVVGAPCEEPSDCRSGGCLSPESGYPGGYCVVQTRHEGSPDGYRQGGCPEGSIALPIMDARPGDIASCFASCRGDSDCRRGYECMGGPGWPEGICQPILCAENPARCPEGTSCGPVDGFQLCLPCEAMCEGRSCGSDGCGGVCGRCAEGEQCAGGSCECVPESDSALCDAAGAECGSIDAVDRCGASRRVDCGACSGAAVCGLREANRCDCDAESDAELCTARGADCGSVRTVDRCGRSRSVTCGRCRAPKICGASNRCAVCTPSCAGRECGGDGCGGQCGRCAGSEVCSAGRCAVDDDCDPVSNSGCPSPNECALLSSEETRCVRMGRGGQGASCGDLSDCRGGHSCFGGICRAICTVATDRGCAFGEFCNGVGGWSVYGACASESERS